MHKPTLIRVLRMLKDFSPENPQIAEQVVQHVVAQSIKQDVSLSAEKLLAGAGIS